MGRANSLTLDVPAYSTGTFELRQGLSRILLLTDGVLEFEGRPFESGAQLLATLGEPGSDPENDQSAVRPILSAVQEANGRDSATIVAWDVDVERAPLQPSG